MSTQKIPKQVQKDIVRIIQKELSDQSEYSLFLFGSRANEKWNEHSDIDIGIMSKKEIPYSRLASIRSQIEDLPTLERIDVVDFDRVSEEFREHALQHIIPLL